MLCSSPGDIIRLLHHAASLSARQKPSQERLRSHAYPCLRPVPFTFMLSLRLLDLFSMLSKQGGILREHMQEHKQLSTLMLGTPTTLCSVRLGFEAVQLTAPLPTTTFLGQTGKACDTIGLNLVSFLFACKSLGARKVND